MLNVRRKKCINHHIFMNWWGYRKYIGQLIRISTLNLFKRLGKDLLSLRRRSISEVEIDNMRTVDKYRNVFMKIPLMRPLAALYRLLQSPVVFLVFTDGKLWDRTVSISDRCTCSYSSRLASPHKESNPTRPGGESQGDGGPCALTAQWNHIPILAPPVTTARLAELLLLSLSL
jgi:hypothetical protein